MHHAGLFLAFADYVTGRRPQPFIELLSLAPSLESDLHSQIASLCPAVTFEILQHHLSKASQDAAYGQGMASEFAASMHKPSMRALAF